MTADAFIERWSAPGASESGNDQLFVSELCDLRVHFRTYGDTEYRNKLSYQPKLTSSPHFPANRFSSFSFPLLLIWVSK